MNARMTEDDDGTTTASCTSFRFHTNNIHTPASQSVVSQSVLMQQSSYMYSENQLGFCYLVIRV